MFIFFLHPSIIPSIHPSIYPSIYISLSLWLSLSLSISLCVSFSSTGTCVTELITPRARSALKRTVIRETTNISCKFCEKKASDPPVSWLEVLLICPHTNHSPSRSCSPQHLSLQSLPSPAGVWPTAALHGSPCQRWSSFGRSRAQLHLAMGKAMPVAPSPSHHHFYGWDFNRSQMGGL